MQFEDMEKGFKSRLKETVPAWDKMKNWDAIEAQLPKPEKKRKWWFFLLPSLSIVLIVLAIGWKLDLFGFKNANISQVSTVVESQLTPDNFPGISSSRKIKTIEKSNTTTNTKNTQKTLKGDRSAQEVTIEKTSAKNLLEGSKNDSNREMNIAAASISASDQPSLSGNTNYERNNIDTANNSQQELVALLPTKSFDLNSTTRKLSPKKVINNVADLNKKYLPWTIGAFGNLSLPSRKFSTNSNEIKLYLDNRDELETMLHSWETGILINKYLTPDLFVSSGIGFQKITERFDWENINISTTPLLSDSAYYYLDGLNNKSYVADTVNAVVTETRRVKNYNSHTFINIPVFLGYDKNIGQFSIEASGGPVLQFYRGFEGRLVDENENFTTGEELMAQGVYQSKVGFSLQANLGISRSIGKFGRIHTGIQYRYGLLSLTDASAGYEQRYNSLGLHVGWSVSIF